MASRSIKLSNERVAKIQNKMKLIAYIFLLTLNYIDFKSTQIDFVKDLQHCLLKLIAVYFFIACVAI